MKIIINFWKKKKIVMSSAVLSGVELEIVDRALKFSLFVQHNK